MINNHSKDISITNVCGATIAGQDTPATSALKLPGQVFKTLLMWHERASTRARLRELDARFLEDVGLSRKDALKEARKPFWMK